MYETEGEILELLEELDHALATNRLVEEYGGTASDGVAGGPYDWQVEFHTAGTSNPERAIIAGNRVGKTRTAAAEVALHLTGQYPDWWKGRRFTEPTSWIVAGPTNELTRDICQTELFGGMEEGKRHPTGKGWVPATAIGAFGFRQCGVPGVLDTIQIRHVTGGWSLCTFKSYEQGAVKFQGVSRHGVWLDEEPDRPDIYSEAQTRVIDKSGLVLFTRTPLFGMSDVIRHFIDGGKGIYTRFATWDDAPHLNKDEKDRLMMSYPEHERDTRTKGVPMMGTGGVYQIADEAISCEPFEIPDYYRRICGVDFGIDHPGAAAWIALDPDADCIYVYDCYRKSGETASYHASAIRNRGAWIPVSWPHDGMIRDKAGGEALKDQWIKEGVNMLFESARYEDGKGGGQAREPITIDILERMRTGRFKVFSNLNDWFEEKRMLHRKDGKIVPKNDDIESATRYAVMMMRYAITQGEGEGPTQHTVDYENYDPLGEYSRGL